MVKHQASSADEKQLQAHLKRLGLNNIPGAACRARAQSAVARARLRVAGVLSAWTSAQL